jgi:hypothetical protein
MDTLANLVAACVECRETGDEASCEQIAEFVAELTSAPSNPRNAVPPHFNAAIGARSLGPSCGLAVHRVECHYCW